MRYGHIVLASTKKEFIASAIRWFTQSNFSHSFVTIPKVLGMPVAIEATGKGVDTCLFDKNYKNNENEGYQIWHLNISQSIKDKAIKSVLNDLEISYGFLQYPYFIIRRICLVVGLDIKSYNNWFRKDGMICSQLCVAYLKACGLEHILKGYGEGSIAPQDLQNIFKSNPTIFKLVEQVRMS